MQRWSREAVNRAIREVNRAIGRVNQLWRVAGKVKSHGVNIQFWSEKSALKRGCY